MSDAPNDERAHDDEALDQGAGEDADRERILRETEDARRRAEEQVREARREAHERR
ncbi:MAG TPA: hypothetical protein VKZ72_07770 [Acidimicrobiales bacterium]|jgi:hypothetical protein|nr:hypothetical protein [Acidimicrobiales bacterium]